MNYNKPSVQNIHPDFPIKSSAEFCYRLKCALGVQDNSFDDIDINQYNYMRNRFVIGLNLEKIINSSFTGVSTKAGDLLSLRMKGIGLNNSGITHCFITLHYDVMLTIRDIGCEVLD